MAASARCVPQLLTALLLGILLQSLPGMAASPSVKAHLDAASAAMKNRDFNGALEHYHSACSEDPTDYMNFMRRATVYLAMGRSRNAIKDFDTVLQMRPDFTQARTKRAELQLKSGMFKAAEEDYKLLLNSDPTAQQHMAQAQTAEQQVVRAKMLVEASQWQQAVQVLSEAIEVAPQSDELRLMRAKCYSALGQLGEAVGDVSKATKIGVANTEAHLLLSQLHYKMGETGEALAEIRECVKLDEEHQACWSFYKHLKKFHKTVESLKDHVANRRYNEALASIQSARSQETSDAFFTKMFLTKECLCLANLGRNKDAIQTCQSAINADPDNIDNYLQRAKAHETEGDYDAALADLQAAHGKQSDNQQINEAIQRVQRMQKQAKKRDYYKILGVPRNADKKEINKAYRKLSVEWHPDKFQDPDLRKEAEKKFMDLRDAKEVLTDPNMRQVFDNGEDPLDAEQNRQRQNGGGGGGHHWGHFHQGGFGQQFHFKFN
eukprot:m.201838 g.201838  ORF g.201838 m.201838 type:complete len:492 (-) comp17712_c0_seq2:3486-4961(-)